MDACVGRHRRSSRVDQGDVYGHGARPQTDLGRCHSLLVLPHAVLVARRIVLRLGRLSRVGLGWGRLHDDVTMVSGCRKSPHAGALSLKLRSSTTVALARTLLAAN